MNESTIRKRLAIATLGVAGAVATGAAHAGDVSWSIGINLPPLLISGGNVAAYYPVPVYVPPPVVYVPPPRVVYAPPVVYGPPVVYRQAPPARHVAPRGAWRQDRWHGDRYAQRGDSDRWRDRDRDGIPNKWDRHD